MKIIHVITSLEIGGAQRLLADLLPLQAISEKVSLLVYERVHNTFEQSIELAGIEIISLDKHNFYDPSIILQMRKIFKNYDLIHAHLFPTLYWVSLAARGLKAKCIYTEHSTTNSRRNKGIFRAVERYMYRRYERIVSISQQTQDALTSWLEQLDKRFVVINNGVNIQKFSSVHQPVIPKSLIMVSRFVKSKDQETVIRAMKDIDKEAVLSLVGDGENKKYCEELAKRIGVADRVLFLGARSDVPELISSSYIGIQSSNWEGFGLTAVEIMASGKPIVATDVDGLRQVVEGAGEVFALGNASELSVKINNLLANQEYYNAISERCKARAMNYDINIMNERYLNIYSD